MGVPQISFDFRKSVTVLGLLVPSQLRFTGRSGPVVFTSLDGPVFLTSKWFEIVTAVPTGGVMERGLPLIPEAPAKSVGIFTDSTACEGLQCPVMQALQR